MKSKEAFIKTYRLPGGARAFWLMIGGCAAALILPLVVKEGMLRMVVSLVPAILALINGQQFTATFSQIMVENAQQDKRR